MSENPTPEEIAAAEAAAAAEAQQQLADAEAEATAKAEAEAAQKPAKKAAKIADPDLLRDVAYDIASNIGVRQVQFEDLSERLIKSRKLKIRELDGGVFEASMLGITSGESYTERDALVNWGNAARRYLLELAA